MSVSTPFGDSRRSWRAHLFEALSELNQLPSGQDSWEPHRPLHDTFQKAHALAETIQRHDLPLPLVAAGSDGSIQIKWRRERRELSFFINPDAPTQYLFVKNSDPFVEGEVSQLSQINKFVNWLFD
jgi:hypothetical protein